jgi:hypothetical protein
VSCASPLGRAWGRLTPTQRGKLHSLVELGSLATGPGHPPSSSVAHSTVKALVRVGLAEVRPDRPTTLLPTETGRRVVAAMFGGAA